MKEQLQAMAVVEQLTMSDTLIPRCGCQLVSRKEELSAKNQR
jgi:hypothetical protein